MILYHGSNQEIEEIDFSKCMPFKDFGKGFYLTYLKEQAILMAKRTSKIYGGNPVVTVYELLEDFFENKELNILDFSLGVSKEWALFVMNNRSKSFIDKENKLSNFDNKYDVVIGPIADDDLALLFRKFRYSLIDIDSLLTDMQYKKTTNQISFHTERAKRYLKKVGVIHG